MGLPPGGIDAVPPDARCVGEAIVVEPRHGSVMVAGHPTAFDTVSFGGEDEGLWRALEASADLLDFPCPL
ncbi:MAG: hypothetical protein KIS91_17170 [Anaerolineae bacterium]|nr:hypothetical protein [Anaerolineae bacterium]